MPEKLPSTVEALTGLPFAGLGFDLTAVLRHADGLRLTRVGGEPIGEGMPDIPTWLPSGWALLVRLNRETGGS